MANKGARARQRYTGETYGHALTFVRTYGLEHGLVPDAVHPQQVLLEASALSALASHVGRHNPSATVPFGIGSVRPDPTTSMSIYLWKGMEDTLVQALLPRLVDGRILGVPGLRWQKRTRRGPVRLVWAGNADVSLDVFEAVDWASAVDRLREHLAEENCWWTHRPPRPAEQQARDELVKSLEPTAARWSTVLRRIGLFDQRQHLDLTDGLPTDAELEGPRPEWLRPRTQEVGASRRPQSMTTIMCRSRKGGTGSTTISVNVAASMALAGKRVLVVDCDRSGNATAVLLSPEQAEQLDHTSWVVAEDIPDAGLLAVAVVRSDKPNQLIQNLRAYLTRVRSDFDVIIVDADPMVADAVGELVVDGVIIPVLLSPAMFGWTETIDHRTPEQRFRDDVFEFLDEEFREWHSAQMNEDNDAVDPRHALDASDQMPEPAWIAPDHVVHGDTEQDLKGEIAHLTSHATDFLDREAALITEECGTNWVEHRQRWIDQLPSAFGYVAAAINDEPGIESIYHPYTPQETADAIEANIDTSRVNGNLLAVVASDLSHAVRAGTTEQLMAARSILQARGVPMMEVIVPDSHLLAEMSSAGPAVLTDPLSAEAEVFQKLTAALLPRLG